MTKPIILVKTCYKTTVFHSSSLKRLSVIGDFLTSADIKAFGRTQEGLLLIDLALLYTQGVFVHITTFCKHITALCKYNQI